jgi:hypothetical protein
MSLGVEGPAPPGDRPGNRATFTKLDDASLVKAAVWWKEALAAIKVLAGTGVEFDCDDLLMLVGQPPHGRQLSTAFAVARRQKIIVPTRAIIRGSRLLRRWIGAPR